MVVHAGKSAGTRGAPRYRDLLCLGRALPTLRRYSARLTKMYGAGRGRTICLKQTICGGRVRGDVIRKDLLVAMMVAHRKGVDAWHMRALRPSWRAMAGHDSVRTKFA